MFCNSCGASIAEGSKFCKECGATLPAVASAASPSPGEPENKKKGGGGFFTSPAGIALVAILGLAVIAGITFGIILLVRSSGNNSVDAETVKVWDEYDEILQDDSTEIAQINMDPNALVKTQEDLKKTQERVAALEKVLKNTGGTNERRTNTKKKSTGTRDIKADQMAAALAAYDLYIQKMNQFFGTLIGANLLDPNMVNTLNTILKELQTLAVDVKTLSEKFLADNTKVTVVKFDPPILKMASVIAPEVEKRVTAVQEAEKQRLEAERASAEQAAAEAERQRQATAAQEQKKQQEQQNTSTDDWKCGDPTCPI